MLALYGHPFSSYTQKVLIALYENGTPFELLNLDPAEPVSHSADWLRHWPLAKFPVLVDGDAVITQLIAIIGYLNDKFPAAGFIPTEPLARARFMEMLAWMNNTVHSTFTHIFLPHKFLDKPELFPDLKAYNTTLYRSMLGELEAMVVAAGKRGHPWLGGDQFGPLDAYALTLLRWGTIAGIDPADRPALWLHVQKVAQLPAVQRVMERERLQLNLYALAA